MNTLGWLTNALIASWYLPVFMSISNSFRSGRGVSTLNIGYYAQSVNSIPPPFPSLLGFQRINPSLGGSDGGGSD